MKGAPQRSLVREFTREAAVTVLIAFASIELMSLAQLSSSSASNLPYPMNHATSGLIFLFSLIGVYGLITKSLMWMFFAFLASLWEMVLGTPLLVSSFQGDAHLALQVQNLASIIMGAFLFLCLFKFHNFCRNMTGLS